MQAAINAKVDRKQVCALMTSFTASEATVIKFLEDNKTWCGVPDQAITVSKANHEKSVKFKTMACSDAPRRATEAADAERRHQDAEGRFGDQYQDRPRHFRHFDRQSAGAMNPAATPQAGNRPAAGSVADATGNWVDTLAPGLAAPLFAAGAARPPDRLLAAAPAMLVVVRACRGRRACQGRQASGTSLLFFIGAFAMRGAGCTWNDIVDRDLDGSVERTRSRPIPSGQVSVAQAALFLILQALVGFAVLISFNSFTVGLGIASLAIVAVYPFMKRITYWPQIVLGLAFSWGALMGWAAAFGRLDWPALLLYAGSISWVIGYDTIYAHQDRDDDALIGIKSTALLFGERTKPMLALFYGLAVILIGAAGFAAHGGIVFALGACRLCRPSRLADRPPRYFRSRQLPAVVQIRPRRRLDPVCRPPARRGAARLSPGLSRPTSRGSRPSAAAPDASPPRPNGPCASHGWQGQNDATLHTKTKTQRA